MMLGDQPLIIFNRAKPQPKVYGLITAKNKLLVLMTGIKIATVTPLNTQLLNETNDSVADKHLILLLKKLYFIAVFLAYVGLNKAY